MSLGLVPRDGDILGHRQRPASPAPFLTALAPSREDLVVWVAGLFPGYGLAALCARAGLPWGLGPALALTAIHGGKAPHDTLDAQPIAVRRRGGRLPQASVSPAARRATRARLRRRVPLTRPRAALLAPLPQTHRPSHRPALGQTSADTAHRDGVAERLPAPAGPQRVAGARALRDGEDPCRRAGAWPIVPTATPPHAQPVDRLHAVPGLGTRGRVVRLDARPALTRCPRVQAGVSAGRVGPGAQAAAGKRAGTAGPQSGQASLPWAFSVTAGRCLRPNPAGHKSLAR